ncbi:hypothetical protein LZ30DRAFT_108711 [Colletotrichum cereale]|nr:hypothetical protein LZ30DRAFT_108711 [Colletotrichum cereale]
MASCQELQSHVVRTRYQVENSVPKLQDTLHSAASAKIEELIYYVRRAGRSGPSGVKKCVCARSLVTRTTARQARRDGMRVWICSQRYIVHHPLGTQASGAHFCRRASGFEGACRVPGPNGAAVVRIWTHWFSGAGQSGWWCPRESTRPGWSRAAGTETPKGISTGIPPGAQLVLLPGTPNLGRA